MISESEWRQIDDVVFDIYQAENVRDLRLRFLERMKQLVPHEISVFDLKGRRRGRDVFFDPVTTTIEKKALDSYYDEFIEKDYTSWATSQMGRYRCLSRFRFHFRRNEAEKRVLPEMDEAHGRRLWLRYQRLQPWRWLCDGDVCT